MGNLMAHIVIRPPPPPATKKPLTSKSHLQQLKVTAPLTSAGSLSRGKSRRGENFLFFFFKTAQCASLPSVSSRPPISTAPSARASFIPAGGVSNHGEQTAKRSEVRGRKKRKSGEEEAAGRSLIDSSISVLPPSACF